MSLDIMSSELKSRYGEAISNMSYSQGLFLLLFSYWLLFGLLKAPKHRYTAPVQGFYSILEPTFVLQARFIAGAQNIIKKGYQNMRGKPFVVRRYDVDFTVLPMRYLEEIRLISTTKLSSKGAQVGNLVPEWTGMEFLIHSDLHVRVLKSKLIPELYKFVDIARGELAYGWAIDVPQSSDWIEVSIENIVRMLVARMTAKVFMGHPVCRDNEWLKISVDFSVDLFTTAFTLKMFPPWAYPIVAHLIPARYRNKRQLAIGRKLVSGLMKKHSEAPQASDQMGHTEAEMEDTLLNWMLDNATPREKELTEMAARQCVLTLASIHTTASNTANMIYDLCAHPEWFPILTEEVESIARELGRPLDNPEISTKQWCVRLEKLDSFFVESQRHHPVLLLNPQRMAMEPFTLRDGTHVPAGTRLAFANFEHQMDPAVVPNPQEFDPMRNYRKRYSSPDQRNKHLAGQTHPSNLAFGYGNQACAGRQFAVAEIKLIMACFLHEFDFKFPEGKGQPRNMHINENVFADPTATVMMRRRGTF